MDNKAGQRSSRLPVPTSRIPVPGSSIPRLAGLVRAPGTDSKLPPRSADGSLTVAGTRLGLLTSAMKSAIKPYDITKRRSLTDQQQQQQTKQQQDVVDSRPAAAAVIASPLSDRPITASLLRGLTPAKENAQTPQRRSSQQHNTSIDWSAVSKEAEILKLKADSQRLQATINQHGERENDLKAKHAKEVADLQIDLRTASGKADELQHQLKNFEYKIEGMQHEMERQREASQQQVNQAEKKAATFEVQCQVLSSGLSDLELRMESLKAEHEAKCVELENTITMLRTDVKKEAQEKDMYQGRVQELHGQMLETAHLQTTIAQHEAEIARLRQELGEREDAKKMSQLLQEELQEYKVLKGENERLNQNLYVAEQKTVEKDQHIAELRQQVEQLAANLKAQEQQIVLAKEQTQEAMRQLTVANQQFASASQETKSIAQMLEAEKMRADAAVQEANKLVSEKERALLEKAALQSQLGAQLAQVGSHQESPATEEELKELRAKLDNSEKREKKLMEAFKATSKEFREVVYILTGYRIDALKQKTYRVSSVYAESKEDLLLFEVSNESMNLKPNDYSAKITDKIDQYVTRNDSYPALLAALQLELFAKTSNIADDDGDE